MMVADDGAAERRGAMVMAANVVLVAVSDRPICGVAPRPEPLGAVTALKDQWKRAPVNSIGWPHARARAVADSAAADFYFAIIRSATGRTCCVVR